LDGLDFYFLLNEEEIYRSEGRNRSSADLQFLEGAGKEVKYTFPSPIPTINGAFSIQLVGQTFLRVRLFHAYEQLISFTIKYLMRII